VLRKFLFYITGSIYPSTIEVSFFEDEHGVISSHTCSKEIHFPHAIFSNENEEAYKIFSVSLMAAIESKTFNVV